MTDGVAFNARKIGIGGDFGGRDVIKNDLDRMSGFVDAISGLAAAINTDTDADTQTILFELIKSLRADLDLVYRQLRDSNTAVKEANEAHDRCDLYRRRYATLLGVSVAFSGISIMFNTILFLYFLV